MSMNEHQQRQIKKLLDDRLEQVQDDQDLLDQLQLARKKALTHVKSDRVRRYGPMLGWAIAASLALALIIPRLSLYKDNGSDFVQGINLIDIELVSELELFEYDLDFYLWLEETDAYSG